MKLRIPFIRAKQTDESVLLTPDGFESKWGKKTNSGRWTDVRSVTAYKRDLLTIDQICLRFDFDAPEKVIVITEDAAGFEELEQALASNLELTNPDWRYEVTYPPFAENATAVFTRSK